MKQNVFSHRDRLLSQRSRFLLRSKREKDPSPSSCSKSKPLNSPFTHAYLDYIFDARSKHILGISEAHSRIVHSIVGNAIVALVGVEEVGPLLDGRENRTSAIEAC